MDIKNEGMDKRKKSRPTQRLYVPPAQRNKVKSTQSSSQVTTNTSDTEPIEDTPTSVQSETDSSNTASPEKLDGDLRENESTNNNEQSLVIMLGNIKMEESDKNVDTENEEMQRAIVNINRKTRPLIKHVNVGNKDVLHISIDDKEVKQKSSVKKLKSAISHEQVSNWEDLLNEEDEISGDVTEQIKDCNSTGIDKKLPENGSSGEEDYPQKNAGPNDLDHVVELYDFPSSFKTQDLIQLYSEVKNEYMYIKWCDETHALLVLSTPNQVKRALQIHHAIIKSRSMDRASNIALQVASRVDLKPAMKRPQTNLQTARRLINNHLGTKSKLSREEHAKEREELRKAKELKRALKQSENDAWDGHPRPSTA